MRARVCLYVCMQTYMCFHPRTYICERIRAPIRIHTYVSGYVRPHAHTNTGMCVHLYYTHARTMYVPVPPPLHLLTSSSLCPAEGGRRGPTAGCAPAGGRHCSSPVCPVRPGGWSRPFTKGPRGERGDDARLRRRGCRGRKAGAGPAPVTAGGGTERRPWGGRSGTAGGSPGETERRRWREQVPGGRRGGAGAPRKEAARGSRGERRGRAARAGIRPCGCPACPPAAFRPPRFGKCGVLLRGFFNFYFFLNRRVCPRRAARAAARTRNLLLCPASTSELHNGI